MRTIVEVISWIIVASLVVLVVMNPEGFVKAVTAVGTTVDDLSKTLSGSGYQRAR
jgi:hypothetical protein